jgi:hypothetical protein
MTVELAADGSVELTGFCPVEDAEVLLQYLLGKPDVLIRWNACEGAHAAIIQVLLVAKAMPIDTPASAFLSDHITPLLRRQQTDANA